MHMLSNFFFLRFQFDKHMLPGTQKYDSLINLQHAQALISKLCGLDQRY